MGKDYWRNLERAIHNMQSFIPEGYTKYWEDHDKSPRCIRIMAAVEEKCRKLYCFTVKANSTNWIQEIPKKVYKDTANAQ